MSSKEHHPLSEYRAMWLFAMFDLPVGTREERADAAGFRKALKSRGFFMLQYSIYARYYESWDAADAEMRRLSGILPPDGRVRLLPVTDRQFAKMKVFHGKKREPTEEPPRQIALF